MANKKIILYKTSFVFRLQVTIFFSVNSVWHTGILRQYYSLSVKIILHFVFLTQVIDDLSGQAAKSVKKDTR